MSVNAPKNTLAYQRKGRPLALQRDLSDASIVDVSQRMKKYANGVDTTVKPETEALWFYLLNHAVSEIELRYDPDEPLPPKALQVLEVYNDRAAQIAVRAFYYLLLITCRESRHCHTKSAVAAQCLAQWGPDAGSALNHYPDTAAVANVAAVFEGVGKACTLRQITEVVRASFYYPGAYGGGYGGPAWGAVSDCLVAYVSGHYSAEMMADTVWTLCHNNGPIFNKGMLYGMYDSTLKEILDVQRSGQIPQLINAKGKKKYGSLKHVDPAMQNFVKLLREAVPDSVAFSTSDVDWNVVHQLGSLNQYSAYGATAPHKSIKPPKGQVGKPGSGLGKTSSGFAGTAPTPKAAQTLDSPMSSVPASVYADKKNFALGHHAKLTYVKVSRKDLQANGK